MDNGQNKDGVSQNEVKETGSLRRFLMILLNRNMPGLGLAGLMLLVTFSVERTCAQDSAIRYGRGVPSAVRLINERSLKYLAATQQEDGAWPGVSNNGSAVTGICRTAIGTLVYAVGKRKDLAEYKAAAAFIKRRIDQDVNEHPFYTRYYMAQAQAQEAAAFLRWKNGDVLAGKLLESESGQIRWSSPIFSDDLVVDSKALESIVFRSKPYNRRKHFVLARHREMSSPLISSVRMRKLCFSPANVTARFG